MLSNMNWSILIFLMRKHLMTHNWKQKCLRDPDSYWEWHTSGGFPQHRCLVLQKDLELIRQIRAMEKDDSVEQFTPYMTKKQKKQLNKVYFYNTRFKGIPKGGWATLFHLFIFFSFCFLFCVFCLSFWGFWCLPSYAYFSSFLNKFFKLGGIG